MSSSADTFRLVPYTPSLQQVWDNFVRQSKNGTFLLERTYMDYHASRFNDHSILIYKGDKLFALLPGHIEGDCYSSHNGLTYGGLIVSREVTSALVLQLFELLIEYFKVICSVNRVIYRPTPHIYHRYPAEEDLYALWRCNARLVGRKVSSVVEQKSALPFSTLRKRKLKSAFNAELKVSEDKDLSSYWKVLNNNLSCKHHAMPVHSIDEIEQLYEAFPNNIRLFTVRGLQKEIVAGCMIYETERVAHVQYIASTDEGRENGAVDQLFDY